MRTEASISRIFRSASGSALLRPYLSFLLLSLSFCSHVLAVDINTEQIEKDHELDNIRSKIKNVESSIEDAKKEVDELFEQLRQNEQAATELSTKIQQSQIQIDDKNRKLTELGKNKDKQEQLLSKQRQQLSEQIREAYKTGRSNYLKLLLNQEHPEQVGRMLAYYDYDSRARSKNIADINLALTEISSLQEKIQSQTQQLEELQQNQQAKLKEFQSYRDSRQVITARLQAYIDEQGIQLQFLQKDEQELAKLVSELKHQELAIQVYEDMPPFTSLKGKLNWPARGKIAKQFGKLRKGGQLKWQGVTIAAKNGVEVKAITTGKVIFADWFRNMGLLLILDHGDGFMSLYGHNERLLKKAGDWVLSGEIIARVGDTGGQQKSGLYFEIRKSGNPINPNLWCKN
ncbi:MAG: peptidoglycan DD-metalloendopeptidase family protein [Gammaproteobacteria bacterium]|jgi:murein hydrolase activator|nr:peptidoglycan DD-metalloendopeptidase family protein [Gammaproteobacteria bacterium]